MNVKVSWSVIVIVSAPGAIENNLFIWGLFWLVYDHDSFWSVIVIVSLPGAFENNFIWGLFWLVYDSFLVCDCGSFVARGY